MLNRLKPVLACAGFVLCTAVLAQEHAGVQAGASAEARGSASVNRQGTTTAASGSGAASAQATDHRRADAALGSGSELNATLSKTIDAGKAKPGDEVTATVMQDVKSGGQVVIPRGSKLIGRVTEAKPHGADPSGSGNERSGGGQSGVKSGARAADASSRLGIVFDRAVLKDGREVPVHAAIQAIAAADATASAGMSHASGSLSGAGSAAGTVRSTGGGLLGGAVGAAGGAVNAAGSVAGTAGGAVRSTVGNVTSVSAGAVGGLNAAGSLTSGSRGVFGLKDIDIQSAGQGSAQGSVLTSTRRNVRLDRGTQMLLVTDASAAGNVTGSVQGAGDAGHAAANASGSASGAGAVRVDAPSRKSPNGQQP